MGDKGASEQIVELAEGQHGVVTVRQLLLAGVSRHMVYERVRAGWLLGMHRGVYSIRGRELTRRGIWMAAVLACGEGAYLSHESAAGLWRLRPPRQGHSDVSVRTAAGRAVRDGIRVHRRPGAAPADIAVHEGIATSSPAGTLFDLAATGIAPRALERATDEAERLRLCTGSDLREVLARNRGRPGAGAIRRLLADHEIGSTVTRLELEERFLALCRERGLPKPLVNSEVLGLRPDFHWPRSGLVVEVDGRESHLTRRGFQDDRDRDSLLTASGYRVMRFTWWDVLRRPGVVAHRVRQALRAS